MSIILINQTPNFTKKHYVFFSIKNIFSKILYFRGNTFLEVKVFEMLGIFFLFPIKHVERSTHDWKIGSLTRSVF